MDRPAQAGLGRFHDAFGQCRVGVDHLRDVLERKLGAGRQEKLVDDIGRSRADDRRAEYRVRVGRKHDLELTIRDLGGYGLADAAVRESRNSKRRTG
jgi:hypothetical protein